MRTRFRALLLIAALIVAGFSVALPTAASAQTPPQGQTGQTPSVAQDIESYLFGSNNEKPKEFKDNLASAEQMFGATGNNTSCWGCQIFDDFAGTTFSAGKKVSDNSAEKLRSLIAAFGSVFALFYLGRSFVAGDASDLLGRWKTFWTLCIAVAAGSLWMTNAFDNTWNYIYRPIMMLPSAILDSVPGGMSGSCSASTVAVQSAPAGAAQTVSQMRDVICGAHKIGMKGIAFGFAMIQSGTGLSWFAMGGLAAFIANFLAGVVIMVMFLWLVISFPLRFIDVLLRLCIVGILTPILIVCAVFKQTRSYVQTGIQNVLYAALLFAFTGVMFKIGSTFFDEIASQTISAPIGSMDSAGVVANSVIMIGCAYIFSSIVGMAPGLAKEFSGFSGSSGSVGESAATFIQGVATTPVKAGAAVAGGVGSAYVSGRVAGAAMGSASAAEGAAAGGVRGALGKGVAP